MKDYSGKFEKPNTWYRLPIPPGKGLCSEGSPYRGWVKKGSSRKLIVCFDGGGVAYDEFTAARPLTLKVILSGKQGFYFPKIIFLNDMLHGGILASNDLRNPFKDWSALQLGYATGDFHVGDNDFQYTGLKGEKQVLHHCGKHNTAALLDMAREIFPDTEQLLITGDSAGAYGCIANAEKVIQTFPTCSKVAVLSDSAQLRYPHWKEIVRDVWKAEPELSECLQSEFLNLDWFRHLYRKFGDRITYLNTCSYRDATLTQYQNYMLRGKFQLDPAALAEFQSDLALVQKTLLAEIPGFHCYIHAMSGAMNEKRKGATIHTAIKMSLFKAKHLNGGASMAEWLDDAVNHGKLYNVGLELIGLN